MLLTQLEPIEEKFGLWKSDTHKRRLHHETSPSVVPRRVAKDVTRADPVSPHTVTPAAPAPMWVQAPVLCLLPFPLSIQPRLVSFSNPTGDITKSDLEHLDVLVQGFDVRETTTATLRDNTPTYRPEISHILGVVNKMASDCSRLWHLSDLQLLASLLTLIALTSRCTPGACVA